MKNPLISVAIYLRGHRLNPDHVSQKLGVQPSRSQTKGRLKSGSKFIAKIGVWTIKVKSNSRPVSGMIDELLQTFGNSPLRLDSIEGVEDAYLDILVALDHVGRDFKTVEFVLTKEQIEKLEQLGLSFCCTLA